MGEPQHGNVGDLERALLEAHPETALAYEVARQLQPILPLEPKLAVSRCSTKRPSSQGREPSLRRR